MHLSRVVERTHSIQGWDTTIVNPLCSHFQNLIQGDMSNKQHIKYLMTVSRPARLQLNACAQYNSDMKNTKCTLTQNDKIWKTILNRHENMQLNYVDPHIRFFGGNLQ